MGKKGSLALSSIVIFWASIAGADGVVQLHCASKEAGFPVAIEIDGQSLRMDGRETVSDFQPQSIYFVDEKLKNYYHILDRVTGELSIFYSKNDILLDVMQCKKVEALQF